MGPLIELLIVIAIIALLAARVSGRVRTRSLKRLAARDVDTNAREILFLKDRVYQLEMQLSILQEHLHKKGQHQSIAVTGRVIKTLKYEWLRRVALIKGFAYLTLLCSEFEDWYNAWRPHMTLEGLRPDDCDYDHKPEIPKRDAETVPGNIERHVFVETRLTALPQRVEIARSYLAPHAGCTHAISGEGLDTEFGRSKAVRLLLDRRRRSQYTQHLSFYRECAC